jgi:hypothetical protein
MPGLSVALGLGLSSRYLIDPEQGGGPAPTGDALLQEDGLSFILQEDGVSLILLEAGSLPEPGTEGQRFLLEDGTGVILQESGSALLQEAQQPPELVLLGTVHATSGVQGAGVPLTIQRTSTTGKCLVCAMVRNNSSNGGTTFPSAEFGGQAAVELSSFLQSGITQQGAYIGYVLDVPIGSDEDLTFTPDPALDIARYVIAVFDLPADWDETRAVGFTAEGDNVLDTSDALAGLDFPASARIVFVAAGRNLGANPMTFDNDFVEIASGGQGTASAGEAGTVASRTTIAAEADQTVTVTMNQATQYKAMAAAAV